MDFFLLPPHVPPKHLKLGERMESKGLQRAYFSLFRIESDRMDSLVKILRISLCGGGAGEVLLHDACLRKYGHRSSRD